MQSAIDNGRIDLRNTPLVDLLEWLSGLHSVTDFEVPALQNVLDVCRHNGIEASYVEGGLFVGAPQARIVLMSHIDRIGFVAIDGTICRGERIQLSYIAKTDNEAKHKIRDRFLRRVLLGYQPQTGQKLFLATLCEEVLEGFSASVFHTFAVENPVSYEMPIPVTSVMPPIARVGDFLIGYFDNLVGVVIALHAVAADPTRLACVITIAEEGGGYAGLASGGRGAQAYIQSHALSKLLVAIDVRPSFLDATTPNTNIVGGGVVLRESEWRKNVGAPDTLLLRADEKALSYIKQYAIANAIPFQTFSGSGITEAGRAFEAIDPKTPLRCLWLQPPVAHNHHPPFEVVAMSDLIGTAKLAGALGDFEP